MVSKHDLQELRLWDEIASRIRHRCSRTSDPPEGVAFGEIYRELVAQIVPRHPPGGLSVLKTDLWNEGIEVDRRLVPLIREAFGEMRFIGLDFSKYVCESAHIAKDSLIEIVRGTLLASPFRQVFDLVIDPSTFDHIPEKSRAVWLASEAYSLKKDGILLIVFDCRLNPVVELFHRYVTRKKYPEWTLIPSHVRAQLVELGFSIIREHALFSPSLIHALFYPGSFLFAQKPWLPLGRLLLKMKFLHAIKRFELSNNSRHLSFLAPQYVIVARREGPIP